MVADYHHSEVKELAVVLGYNEYKQLNGSIFYAIETFLALIEKYKKDSEPALKEAGLRICDLFTNGVSNYCKGNFQSYRFKFYIVGCRMPQRKRFLDSVKKLICEKYPISSGQDKLFDWCTNRTYDYSPWSLNNRKENGERIPSKLKELKKILPKETYQNMIETMANIKCLLANIEFVDHDRLNTKDIFKKIYINNSAYQDAIQVRGLNIFVTNRATKNLSDKQKLSTKLLNGPENTFLYEYPEQYPKNADMTYVNYPLKLGFKYFIPKEMLRPLKERYNETLISDPGDNKNKTFAHKIDNVHDLKMYGDKFDEDCNKYLYFFEKFKSVDYYQDLDKWDENNRLIPECMWYGTPYDIYTSTQTPFFPYDSTRRREELLFGKSQEEILKSSISLDPIGNDEPLINWMLDTTDCPFYLYEHRDYTPPKEPNDLKKKDIHGTNKLCKYYP